MDNVNDTVTGNAVHHPAYIHGQGMGQGMGQVDTCLVVRQPVWDRTGCVRAL